MKILSIDVGIKNLAYCFLEINKDDSNKDTNKNSNKNDSKDFNILKWNTINLIDEKKCNECSKPAQYSKNSICYCKKHTKNCGYLIPSQRDININKLKLSELYEYINSNDISLDILNLPKKNIKRENILTELHSFNNLKFLDPIKKDNAGVISLIEIGINLQKHLDEIISNNIDANIPINTNKEINNIDLIRIENQLSSIAVRMKTLQGMITQYFIMRGYENIEYVSSQNKLRLFFEKDKNSERTSGGEKTSYSERKKLGIKYCQELLNKKGMNDWLEFMSKHNKRDDLADCFLQGIC